MPPPPPPPLNETLLYNYWRDLMEKFMFVSNDAIDVPESRIFFFQSSEYTTSRLGDSIFGGAVYVMSQSEH